MVVAGAMAMTWGMSGSEKGTEVSASLGDDERQRRLTGMLRSLKAEMADKKSAKGPRAVDKGQLVLQERPHSPGKVLLI